MPASTVKFTMHVRKWKSDTIPRCAGLTVFRNITVFNITHKSKQQNAIADIVRSFTGIMITKKVEKEEEPGTQIWHIVIKCDTDLCI